ncbi:Mur ligase family protein [Luteimonas soli]|uniref:Mur ligase family protein n=1 Tax=Luteimonas soli TaxID=1648966 RepID=A0ABV7XHK6_9GAMM
MTHALDSASEPYEDSRRLTGCNFYFSGTGAVLEAAPGLVFDDATLARWRDNIATARRALGWTDGEMVVRRHRSGVSLAFAAPLDCLYAATEVNEWAWWAAVLPRTEESRRAALPPPLQGEGRGGDGLPVGQSGVELLTARGETHPLPNPPLEGEGFKAGGGFGALLHAPGHAAVWDADSAMRTLRALAAAETNPALLALQAAATERDLPCLPDDDEVSIGAGTGSRTWPAGALPDPATIDWPALHAIPTALVTGSNGKTTTVRLLAAMARAHGWHTAHSCTDGVFFDGRPLESGDYSGPTGARTALRQPEAQAAVLETARGGMLRRGLALCHADVAVVTNVSADHFGEYGIHDLDDLAAAKLTVARAIGDGGLLVLNGDDAVLRRQAEALTCPKGWFAQDFDAPLPAAHRAGGGATCGVREGRLRLSHAGSEHDLGAIEAMPLTLGGRAAYNVANAAAAALAAHAMGTPADAIAATLARFGSGHGDNPGRLQHWRFGTLDVYVDYAHNPDGLQGLLHAVGADRRDGRLAVILGHAGNREDADLRAVAVTAAEFDPELVVLKDIGGYERGRESGDIARIMREALGEAGVGDDAIETRLDEVEAARRPLEWARDGDLVVLPVHELGARAKVVALLDTLRASDWRPGMPLPKDQETEE